MGINLRSLIGNAILELFQNNLGIIEINENNAGIIKSSMLQVTTWRSSNKQQHTVDTYNVNPVFPA